VVLAFCIFFHTHMIVKRDIRIPCIPQAFPHSFVADSKGTRFQ